MSETVNSELGGMSDNDRAKIREHLYPETAIEALAKWDAGESVMTVEMGGLGPGYEQCIHIMAFEIIRAWGGKRDAILAMPKDKRWDALAGGIPEAIMGEIGPSGAQVGAAVSLAWITIDRGWREAIDDPAVKDRHIQVSKAFPQVAKP